MDESVHVPLPIFVTVAFAPPDDIELDTLPLPDPPKVKLKFPGMFPPVMLISPALAMMLKSLPCANVPK